MNPSNSADSANSADSVGVADSSERTELVVRLPGRDEIRLGFDIVQGVVSRVRLSALGCPALLALVIQWRPLFEGKLKDIPYPQGNGHGEILLRELILRARGEWTFPYEEQELCHCRAVPTARVDAAVIGGAHTVEEVSRRTSAGTSCGSCQRDIVRLIACRLVG